MEFFAALGHHHGKRGPTIALQKFLLELHAFQPFGLKVEQIMVVPQVPQSQADEEREEGVPGHNQLRPVDQGPAPGVDIQRRRDGPGRTLGIGPMNQGGQGRERGQPAEQDAAAGDDAQLGDAREIAQPDRIEGHAVATALVVSPGPMLRVVASKASKVDIFSAR